MLLLLQDAAAVAPETTLYQIGEVFYLFIIGYAIAYVVWFLAPLLGYVSKGTLRNDLDEFKSALEVELERDKGQKSERSVELIAEIEEVQEEIASLSQRAADLEEEGDEEEASAVRSEWIPELEKRWDRLNAELESVAERDEEGAVARLESVAALHTSYNHPFVKEAVAQLRSRFPRADYQKFELDLLPSFGSYNERVSMARRMAAVFVLIGLLGTMIKLDGVVEAIRALTNTAEMEPGEFLANMGTLMQGIGGAFDNSIYGVMLMVVALIVVGFINRAVQRRLDHLDVTVGNEVVPILLALHNRYMPLRGTQSQLDKLNASVEGLNVEMLESLRVLDQHVSNMGDRMGEMLSQFGSYQQHYTLLNDWVKTLQSASGQLETTASELVRSSGQLQTPISEMNLTLQEHLKLQANFQDSGYVDNLLQQIKASLDEAVGKGNTQIEALTRQTVAVQGQMEATATALQASSPEQLSSAIKHLSTTSRELNSQMAESARALRVAAEHMERYSESPTFFYWLTQQAYPYIRRRIMHLFGKGGGNSNRSRRRSRHPSSPVLDDGAVDSLSTNGKVSEKPSARAVGTESRIEDAE